jgi:phenylacetate-CoA ligase
MNATLLLKNNLKNIPPYIGIFINRYPYSLVPGIGKIYKYQRQEINFFDSFSPDQKQDFVFKQIKNILDYAYQKIPFYREYYTKRGFHPGDLKNYQDIKMIPIINKKILREYPIEQRSSVVSDRYIANTGGSSGIPFGFYTESKLMGYEIAHMHKIWEKLGYKSSDLKLFFKGRNNLRNAVEYDIIGNSYMVDLYKSNKDVAGALKRILKIYKIKYLHGYPSSIYNFALYCKNEDIELQAALSKNLKGIFLGSEYPHPLYRNVVENVFGTSSISWYGHTERCVLAYEKNEKYFYEPFQTYGYTEAVSVNDEYHLIGTSYFNRASPLIRYDTDDIVSDIKVEDDILKGFKITRGRSGEFVIDKQGNNINLTALIFGRHHQLFNQAKFIQVKQVKPGEIEIHFVADTISEKRASELFDKRNLALEIKFVKRDAPVLTISGKVNLLLHD